MRQAGQEITNDPIVLKILEILRQQNRTEKDLLVALKLPNSTFTKWKYQELKSYKKHLNEIAEYLGVTPRYLTEGIDDYINIDTISTSEMELLKMYRGMKKENRECLMKTANVFYNATLYERKMNESS